MRAWLLHDDPDGARMAADYDSPWKEALDIYFEQFLALLFPEIHLKIDWSRGYESLDKEFQQLVRDAEVGRRTVDKLVKVWTLDGAIRWVLIHIEVQATRESAFPERIYIYNYRIFDRYNVKVASLAVLADDDPLWRPAEYHSEIFGFDVTVRFPTVKLLEFRDRVQELEASRNPFAKVVLAHLKALETRGDDAGRYAWKLRLVRGLYEQGFSNRDVRELFRFIDWLMVLPGPLERAVWQDVQRVEEENRMPYVPMGERIGRWDGLCQGIEALLKFRFGDVGLQLMPEVRTIDDSERLKAILDAIGSDATLDDIRGLCLSKPQ